jgi:hypothetical protein
VTRVELVAGLGLIAIVASAITFLTTSAAADTDQKAAETDARRILGAAEGWAGDNPNLGCPSVSQLIEDGALSRDRRVDDPWGGKYRIACDHSAIVVRSAGVDRKANTADDVRVESERR